MERLQDYDNTNTEFFKLTGLNKNCRVLDIYDGDTLTVVLEIFEHEFFKFNVRLSGIDTCEMHSINEENQKLAVQARNRLFELISNEKYQFESKKQLKDYFNKNPCIIWIECEDFDKYGRVLGKLRKQKDDSLSFSEILIQEKLAYQYGGGTKLDEEEQLELLTK